MGSSLLLFIPIFILHSRLIGLARVGTCACLDQQYFLKNRKVGTRSTLVCNLDTSHEVQMDKNKEEEEEKKSEIENLHTN